MQLQNEVGNAMGCVTLLVILIFMFVLLKVSQRQNELYSHILSEVASIKLELSALRDQLRSNP